LPLFKFDLHITRNGELIPVSLSPYQEQFAAQWVFVGGALDNMLFGALALLGGLLWLPLGQWLALVAYLFLAWLTEGARLFANMPYAAVQLPPFPLWVLLGYYAIVVGGWLWSIGLHREHGAMATGEKHLYAPEQTT
jgi:hypothetical protein